MYIHQLVDLDDFQKRLLLLDVMIMFTNVKDLLIGKKF